MVLHEALEDGIEPNILLCAFSCFHRKSLLCIWRLDESFLQAVCAVDAKEEAALLGESARESRAKKGAPYYYVLCTEILKLPDCFWIKGQDGMWSQ